MNLIYALAALIINICKIMSKIYIFLDYFNITIIVIFFKYFLYFKYMLVVLIKINAKTEHMVF